MLSNAALLLLLFDISLDNNLGNKSARSAGDISESAGSKDILSNKTFTNTTGKVNNYTSPTQGMDAAMQDFYALNPSNVRIAPNGTVLGDLANGTTINIHPGTSVGGAPTLEIFDTLIKMKIKIRY